MGYHGRSVLLVPFVLPLLIAAAPAPETITGEVVDTTCYLLHDGRGPEHRDCALTCVKAGSPAAILDEKTGRLVFALAPGSADSHHGKRPDEALLPYVGKRVRVTGLTVTRGGVTAIVIEKVAEAPPVPVRK
jgi:hypothetical protein